MGMECCHFPLTQIDCPYLFKHCYMLVMRHSVSSCLLVNFWNSVFNWYVGQLITCIHVVWLLQEILYAASEIQVHGRLWQGWVYVHLLYFVYTSYKLKIAVQGCLLWPCTWYTRESYQLSFIVIFSFDMHTLKM